MRSLTLVALIAVPAFAQTIYSWEDADGLHYTDDLGQVPKEKKVEGRVIDARPASSGLVAPKPPETVALAPQQQSTELEWRDRFIAGRRRIEMLQQSISALRASLPPRIECVPQPARVGRGGVVQATSRCQVNPVHDQLVAQITQQEVELRDAWADLEALDRRASMLAVPREWRRGW